MATQDLFDEAYYLAVNADVAAAGVDAFSHFLASGWSEGRDPNPFFDTSAYLADNADVLAAGLNPLEHFDSFGAAEGRTPSALFSESAYRAANADVASAVSGGSVSSGLAHFLASGAVEGRNAPGFDDDAYLAAYSDVASAIAAGTVASAEAHYRLSGAAEGRTAQGTAFTDDDGGGDGATTLSYPIVDTNQTLFYDATSQIGQPAVGQAFYGQDAHYQGTAASYQINGDGTVTDLVTGLVWQQAAVKGVTYSQAASQAETLTSGGYSDWRLPTIKELYSLVQFSGVLQDSAETSTPFLDADVFTFEYGDESAGERLIDVQYWSSTQYAGTITVNLNNPHDDAVFGVNFADGRIKGYAPDTARWGLYVRGDSGYGTNSFTDNGDGTITDTATGLMWAEADSGAGMTWQDALAYAEGLETGGYTDWRLPNAKELQSLVDHSRAPDARDAGQVGPAIDPVFDITNIGTDAAPDYPFFWSSTTHLEGLASRAVYLAFGAAWGYDGDVLVNAHGAGAQRTDPKTGDPDDYAGGFGPQNDLIRIFNYVRPVRDVTDGGVSKAIDLVGLVDGGDGMVL